MYIQFQTIDSHTWSSIFFIIRVFKKILTDNFFVKPCEIINLVPQKIIVPYKCFYFKYKKKLLELFPEIKKLHFFPWSGITSNFQLSVRQRSRFPFSFEEKIIYAKYKSSDYVYTFLFFPSSSDDILLISGISL